MKKISLLLSIFIFTALGNTFIYASQTQYINLQGLNALSKGEFDHIQVNAEGKLLLSPQVKELYDTRNLLIQSTAQTIQGIYFTTAKDAGVFFYSLDSKEITKVYENSKSLSVTGIAVEKNMLYFVESPSNTLYSLNLEDKEAIPTKIREFSEVNYVWQLAIDNGSLYLATGSKAYLYRIPLNDLSKEPEIIFKAQEEKHFITLLVKAGTAYLGSEGSGGVYQVDLSTKKAKTLYKGYEGEISDILLGENNEVFITTSSKEAKAVGTDFDYTDTLLKQQLEYQIVKSQLIDSKQINPDGSAKGEPGLAIKNSLYKITEGKVEKLITLDNMSLNNLFLKDNTLIIGTSGGRIFEYRLKDQSLSLLASLQDEDIVKILPSHEGLLAFTSNIGRVYTIQKEASLQGSYTSEVIDLGNKAILGKMTLEVEKEDKGSVGVFVRGGQTQSPENNWGEWVGPFKMGDPTSAYEALSALGEVRFIQYRVDMVGKGEESPEFIRILAPYKASNRAPAITLFSAFYDKAQDGGSSQALQIRWSATDGDKDQLLYRIYFKQKADVDWGLLSEAVSQDKMAIDTKLLPDGVYHFKLEVSDELDNSPQTTAKTIQFSNYVLINNTPPSIDIISTLPQGDSVKIQGNISNPVGIIAKAYFKVGAIEQWTFITPDSGIYDNKKVSFTITVPLSSLKNLENIVFFRAFDMNMNQVSYRVKLDAKGNKIN